MVYWEQIFLRAKGQLQRQWVQGLEVRQAGYRLEEVQTIQGTLSLYACINLHTKNQDCSGEAESLCQVAFGGDSN